MGGCVDSRTDPVQSGLARRVTESLHSWNISVAEAIALQKRLADRVECDDRLGRVDRVAGVDVGYDKARGVARAAVVVIETATLETVETAVTERPTAFPYVPGLLSFRELPAAIEALDRLTTSPDVLLCDGHGFAHPRRFGIASHLGVFLDMPSIGVAKSRLVGEAGEPGSERGDRASLTHKGEAIGTLLRTRTGVSPIFVSVGHRVNLDTAVRIVLECTTRFRLPETTRRADRLSKTRS